MTEADVEAVGRLILDRACLLGWPSSLLRLLFFPVGISVDVGEGDIETAATTLRGLPRLRGPENPTTGAESGLGGFHGGITTE